MRKAVLLALVPTQALLIWSLFNTRPLGDFVFTTIGLLIFGLVGALVVVRRNGHNTGWLLIALGVTLTLGDALSGIPGISPSILDWVESWVWTWVFALFALLTLTFPSGHGPSGNLPMARVGRAAIRALPVLMVGAALTDELGGPEAEFGVANPIGILPSWLAYPILFAVVLILIGGVVTLVVRRRRAVGAERLQITWVVFGFILLVTAISLTFVFLLASAALGYDDPGDAAWTPAYGIMVTFPVWFGIAILRYNLFEIDRLVSRTLSYTIVVALLTAVYITATTVLTSLVPGGNNLYVAGSTLLVAALFNPLRRRVQTAVDRRFNRSRYDAQIITARFAELVNNEVDADRLVTSWIAAVTGALQPSGISVWVRGDGKPVNRHLEN